VFREIAHQLNLLVGGGPHLLAVNADHAAAATNPQKLRCGSRLIGREYDAEGRENDIEAGVRKRQILCVRLLEFDR
jgi:hypothetical protein